MSDVTAETKTENSVEDPVKVRTVEYHHPIPVTRTLPLRYQIFISLKSFAFFIYLTRPYSHSFFPVDLVLL